MLAKNLDNPLISSDVADHRTSKFGWLRGQTKPRHPKGMP